MKKILYLALLIIGGIILGSLIAERTVNTSLEWLSFSGGFEFPADKPLLNFTIFTITIGFSFNINIAQLLMILLAIFIYYKTAPKLIP
ncbi:MAG: DUF4321 domain-containing protein [Prevotella sp.]|nr:DUF4321 domain-containing protein [Alistipes senegalensis]MCM1358802.1 DUF4321 domain-containing protein [Prevotella sp.]MCM1473032.1 DUF4321 domain-containing protein [Muribaculaceae bacterium]MDE6425699.1 DUF4321 domain-containing protein [Ruminococcus sp.]